MLVYVTTIEHLHVYDNYVTTGNKYVNPGAVNDVTVEDIHVYPDANWPEEALKIIEESGLQDAYESLRNQQAERVQLNTSNDEISIGLDDSFQITVSATDGKDRAVI